MITLAIKGKSKIFKLLIKSKIYKKNKKETKTTLQTMILNIIRIKKKVPSLMKMKAIIVKTDWGKEGKSRIKGCRNYRIMMENKTCIMILRIMIGMLRIIIFMIGSILTMIIEMHMIIEVNLKDLLKTISTWLKILKISNKMKIFHPCKSNLFLKYLFYFC